MSTTWYEHRFNFYGCHVIAYIDNQAVMQGEIDRFGFMPDVAGIRVFKDTEHGWELEKPFTDCVLLWEESKLKDIRCSEALPGDYAVIGTHKYKIAEKHDDSFILEGLFPMDIHAGVIDYCLTKTRPLPRGEGFYTDRDDDCLYQTAAGDWFFLGLGDNLEFTQASESMIESFINVKPLKLPE